MLYVLLVTIVIVAFNFLFSENRKQSLHIHDGEIVCYFPFHLSVSFVGWKLITFQRLRKYSFHICGPCHWMMLWHITSMVSKWLPEFTRWTLITALPNVQNLIYLNLPYISWICWLPKFTMHIQNLITALPNVG